MHSFRLIKNESCIAIVQPGQNKSLNEELCSMCWKKGQRLDAQIWLCVQVSLMTVCTRAPGGTVTAAMSLFLPNPLRPRPQRPLLSVLQRGPRSSHTSTRSSWPPALWRSLVRDYKNYRTQETDINGYTAVDKMSRTLVS